jgi:hypothetical protein
MYVCFMFCFGTYILSFQHMQQGAQELIKNCYNYLPNASSGLVKEHSSCLAGLPLDPKAVCLTGKKSPLKHIISVELVHSFTSTLSS